ncbi:TonB C-terminal domain-containing protein [Candidatus Thioglobus sp.]|nr:TonB C-terminal domain-containing protein [Candidatus Thioglobus sp.]
MRKLLLAISLVFTLNAQADNNESLMLDDQLNISQNIWVESVITKINSYWRYSGARSDWFCYVFITQDRNGNVNTVDVDNCGDSIMNIDENPKLSSFKNSIERAVYKASPFPLAPSEDAFSEQIIFEFRVDGIEIM